MKYFITIPFIGMAITAGLYLYITNTNNEMRNKFNSVNKYDDLVSILDKLGKPDIQNSNCYNNDFWVDKEVENQKCVLEIQYNASIIPVIWTIGFDKNDKAILKYEHASP